MANNATLNIPRDKQFDLFGKQTKPAVAKKTSTKTRRIFIDPDPEELSLGLMPLKAHLEKMGQQAPFVVRRLLSEQDWSAFEANYQSSGRPPYAPRAMMGLILYGVMNGITSLRSLEKLARMDLGCMWVTGGICPDHSNIGRFILLQDKLIAGPLFSAVTAAVLRETGADSECVAGDGTVIQAACSRYKLLKAQAIRERAEAADREAQADPDNARKQQQAVQARQAKARLNARAQIRKDKGKPTAGLSISPTEPEAAVQPQKHQSGYAASYKPSVLANSVRVVVAQTVHPSGEVTVLPSLLDQCQAVTGRFPQELLLDAGYCSQQTLKVALERDISLLCPESRKLGQPKSGAYFTKGQFQYDEYTNSYGCPAGEMLTPMGSVKGTDKSPGYTLYGTSACGNCLLRSQCTQSVKGRAVKRYAGDEAKEALRQVMQHPKAQQRFSQRKAMVEPVFSVLRGRQGLNRFLRKGLAGVKLEFALHVLAYNLSRAVAVSLYFTHFVCFYVRVVMVTLLSPVRLQDKAKTCLLSGHC